MSKEYFKNRPKSVLMVQIEPWEQLFFTKSDQAVAYWTSESDRFYGITLVCMLVSSFVRNELISETAPTIFLKLGMKLGDNKGKKIARPDFWLNFSFWPILIKCAEKWPFWPNVMVSPWINKEIVFYFVLSKKTFKMLCIIFLFGQLAIFRGIVTLYF